MRCRGQAGPAIAGESVEGAISAALPAPFASVASEGDREGLG